MAVNSMTFQQSATLLTDIMEQMTGESNIQVQDESEFVSGGNFRVYDTKAGKIGIIVAEDLFFPESARVLTLCDADVIICLFKQVEGYMPQIMLRAGAFSNGVPMALCAKNYACVSDIRGKVVLSSSSEIIKTKLSINKK